MKKNIKVFYLLLIPLLLSGCTVDYDAAIYSKNNITENIKLNIPNKSLGENKKDIKKVLEEETKIMETNRDFEGYELKNKYQTNFSNINLFKNYSSLTDFSKSIFLKNIFENITVIENKEYFLFQTTGRYFHENIYGAVSEGEFDPTTTEVEDVTIKIRIANEVIDTNADIKNEKDNIYTWVLRPGQMKRSIYFKYNHKKRYDVIIKMMITNNFILFILFTGIFIFAIIGLIYLIFKNTLENKI